MTAEQCLKVALYVIEEVTKGAFGPFANDGLVDRFTVHDEAHADSLSTRGALLRKAAAVIDFSVLPHEIALSAKVALAIAERWSKSSQWWWLVHDPLDLGFYAMFGPTAYAGSFLLNRQLEILSVQPLNKAGDCDRYLALVADITASLDSMLVRLKGQAERQIVMPAMQLEQTQPLIKGLATSTPQRMRPARERLAALEGTDRFLRILDERLETDVALAFERLSIFLAGDYADRAGDRVGLHQYPGGREVYEELVAHHLTLKMSAADVHAAGIDRMRDIRASMAALRANVGFHGDDEDYLRAIGEDAAWRADSADGVAAIFRRYIERFKPHVPRLFNFTASADYDVRPLPEAAAGATTFGFYQRSTSPGATGYYVFNAANLTKVGLNHLASLNYHELVPGHHFHMASQMENVLLPAVRKHAYFTSFAEGWAEYAATLAGEVGCYEAPEERFGRLMMDAFLTCRLVVDTGMNAFGWTLEKARAYMYENGFVSKREVDTETIRYSCDVPGQALAYKMGDDFLLNQRERMRRALGDAFDIRDFHDAVLRPGALPLPVVAENIDRAISAKTSWHAQRCVSAGSKREGVLERGDVMDLITHNEVLIRSPASCVWPHIMQTDSWKAGAVLKRVADASGASGELFAAVMPGSQAVLYYVADVEVVTNSRRTIKLLRDKCGPLLGFATWGLREADGGTALSYDVYAEYGQPSGDSAQDPLSDWQRIAAEQRSRFQSELEFLKNLVEGSQAAARAND